MGRATVPQEEEQSTYEQYHQIVQWCGGPNFGSHKEEGVGEERWQQGQG